MNEENLKALADLREFIREEKAKPKEISQSTEKQITWKEIAIGVYVGGIALGVTSTIVWIFFTAVFYAALKTH